MAASSSMARSTPPPLQIHHLRANPPISLHPPHPILHFATHRTPCVPALKTASDGSQEVYGPDLLRKPQVSAEEEEEVVVVGDDRKRSKRKGVAWVEWEDQILHDTVPLVGFVRMILHSGKYKSGDRLSPEHEKTILERLLPHHPECERKIGNGIDYITVGYHPDFESSRCLFIVRKDGELVDFSYWKCVKGFIRKNYPLYADGFFLRHFRRHRRSE